MGKPRARGGSGLESRSLARLGGLGMTSFVSFHTVSRSEESDFRDASTIVPYENEWILQILRRLSWLLLLLTVSMVASCRRADRQHRSLPSQETGVKHEAPSAMIPVSNHSTIQKEADNILQEMVFIKGGDFVMGTKEGLPHEGPVHKITVPSFWIDQHEVTVAQFSEFVSATGYQTEAEQYGWSGVFDVAAGAWMKKDGADWRRPDGRLPAASLKEPVTQVSWNDAMAYAKWAKKRLPTEAEFEFAARGGLDAKKYAWGDELRPHGKYLANYWQGTFPQRDLGEDGFIGRAPVKSFPPNGYGLYDMMGNVWEWCADWFSEDYYQTSPALNPRGPSEGQDRVIRGGSWLCSENYCTGYRVAARNHSAPDSGLNNLGFRCARTP